MKALSIIQAEHRNLGIVLMCFETLVHNIEDKNENPKIQLFRAVLHYIEGFLQRFHHPKEDGYLFPALVHRYPEAKELIQQLKDQHQHGVELTKALQEALSTYDSKGATAYPNFRDAVDNYIHFERMHVYKEEEELLPLAREYLTSEDWEPIDRAFTDHDDPIFGDISLKHYQQLRRLIINISLFGEPLL
jgi:branched-chain amino acid transport system ATP-binding protein